MRLLVACLLVCGAARADHDFDHDSDHDSDHDDGDDCCAVAGVTVGEAHTCAFTRGGALYCWGENNDGQLGDGSSGPIRTRPVRALLDGVHDAAASFYFTCAVNGDGAWCWGTDSQGVIGDGTEGGVRLLPELALPGARRVTVGEQHACALDGSGRVFCWGANYLGQVGDGAVSVSDVLSPMQVVAIGAAQQVSVGNGFHTCARVAGMVACWGSNSIGQLGNGGVGGNQPTPVFPSLPAATRQVAAGFSHSCALLQDGSVWCWGEAGDGALGISAPPVFSDVPVRVDDLDEAVRVSAGMDRTCAITDDHRLFCWGIVQDSSIFGLSGFVVDSETPRRVRGLHHVSQVAVGFAHTCAIADGRLYCWGANQYGELGVGDTVDRARPTRVHLRCRD